MAHENLREILRGIRDGLRDEVLTIEEVSGCLDDKTVKALEKVVEKANKNRQALPKEKRFPWKPKKTPEETLQAQALLTKPGGKIDMF